MYVFMRMAVVVRPLEEYSSVAIQALQGISLFVYIIYILRS